MNEPSLLDHIGPHRVLCGDVTRGAIARLMGDERADVVYCDPPWGPGLLCTFMRAAGVESVAWSIFLDRFAESVATHRVPDGPIFLEMGLAWVDDLRMACDAHGIRLDRQWGVHYGSGSSLRPSALLYGGPPLPPSFDPSGLRGAALPRACVMAVGRPGGIVLDPCCGKGYSARAAVAARMAFRGVEIGPLRLKETTRWLTGTISQS